MRYILLTSFIIFSMINASYLNNSMSGKIIENHLKQLIPAVNSDESHKSCDFFKAADCFGILGSLFKDCNQALAAEGKNISYDAVCVKAFMEFKIENLKKCSGCVCPFAQFAKVKFPLCMSGEEIIEEGNNIFRQFVSS